jgi:hypothetical protein
MMAVRRTYTADQKPGAAEEKPAQTHHASAVVFGVGTVSATATVLRTVYIFRCSTKSGLFAVSLRTDGDNLPQNVCSGEWLKHGEALVEPGVSNLGGFVSSDLYRDLERHGFHIASGVRTTVSPYQAGVTASVSVAISAANSRTGFFDTDA